MGRKKTPPSEETLAAPQDGEPILDVEFDRASAMAMARKDNISESRWERIQQEVDIRDLLEMLHPEKRMISNKICCPFHGADRTPSFTVYPRTNSAYCFGCPDKDGYWDAVKIVARTHEISVKKAVQWIEDQWDMPPLDEDDPDEGEGSTEEVVVLSVDDVAPAYVVLVRDYAIIHRQDTTNTTDEVVEALERFFSSAHRKDALPLARLLGSQRVNALRSAKIEAATQ